MANGGDKYLRDVIRKKTEEILASRRSSFASEPSLFTEIRVTLTPTTTRRATSFVDRRTEEALAKTIAFECAYGSFGHSVSHQLDEMKPRERIIAEKVISEIIFRGKLNQLTESSTLLLRPAENPNYHLVPPVWPENRPNQNKPSQNSFTDGPQMTPPTTSRNMQKGNTFPATKPNKLQPSGPNKNLPLKESQGLATKASVLTLKRRSESTPNFEATKRMEMSDVSQTT